MSQRIKKQSCFSLLPDEVLSEILLFVPVQEIVHVLSFVNKRIAKLVSSDLFWNVLCKLKASKSKLEDQELKDIFDKEEECWKKTFLKIPNPVLQKMKKVTFLPNTTKSPNRKSILSCQRSRYGGYPFIPNGEEIKYCLCKEKRPIPFVMQVNSTSLPTPERPFGEGLFQMFFCANCCEEDCRVLNPEKLRKPPRKDIKEKYAKKEENIIQDWGSKEEYPNSRQFDVESWSAWELFYLRDDLRQWNIREKGENEKSTRRGANVAVSVEDEEEEESSFPPIENLDLEEQDFRVMFSCNEEAKVHYMKVLKKMGFEDIKSYLDSKDKNAVSILGPLTIDQFRGEIGWGNRLTEFMDKHLDRYEYGVEFGDKYLGWGYFIQGVCPPDCQDCGKTCTMLFQVSDSQNARIDFGDTGNCHVFVCTNCESQKNNFFFDFACD